MMNISNTSVIESGLAPTARSSEWAIVRSSCGRFSPGDGRGSLMVGPAAHASDRIWMARCLHARVSLARSCVGRAEPVSLAGQLFQRRGQSVRSRLI